MKRLQEHDVRRIVKSADVDETPFIWQIVAAILIFGFFLIYMPPCILRENEAYKREQAAQQKEMDHTPQSRATDINSIIQYDGRKK